MPEGDDRAKRDCMGNRVVAQRRPKAVGDFIFDVVVCLYSGIELVWIGACLRLWAPFVSQGAVTTACNMIIRR